MSEFDINSLNFNNIPEDEDSEELAKIIQEFKSQNITNNIDFEKAEQERLEIEAKQKQAEEEKRIKEEKQAEKIKATNREKENEDEFTF